jgi:hypothetical protein
MEVLQAAERRSFRCYQSTKPHVLEYLKLHFPAYQQVENIYGVMESVLSGGVWQDR